MKDVDCADYAVAFACNRTAEDVGHLLWKAGRFVDHDGTEDRWIMHAINACGFRAQNARTDAKTIRTFARERREGSFLVFTCDHVVAVVDGFVCDRPENSDLQRIEKIWEIV